MLPSSTPVKDRPSHFRLQDQVFRTVHIWSSVFDLPAFVPSHPGQRFVCESYTKLIIENGHSLA